MCLKSVSPFPDVLPRLLFLLFVAVVALPALLLLDLAALVYALILDALILHYLVVIHAYTLVLAGDLVVLTLALTVVLVGNAQRNVVDVILFVICFDFGLHLVVD